MVFINGTCSNDAILSWESYKNGGKIDIYRFPQIYFQDEADVQHDVNFDDVMILTLQNQKLFDNKSIDTFLNYK
jgi:hypothetical protein